MCKMHEWQTERVWTFDPVSITAREKKLIPIDHEANAKQWRVTLFGFPLKGNLVFLRISLRNPLSLMETMEPSKQSSVILLPGLN